jgi:hypothetical protein
MMMRAKAASTLLRVSESEASMLPLIIHQLIQLHDQAQPAMPSVLRLRPACRSFLRAMRNPHRFWHELLMLLAADHRWQATTESAYSTLRRVVGLCTMQPALVRSAESVECFNRLIARGVLVAPYLRRHGYNLANARSARTGFTALEHAIRQRAIRAVMELVTMEGSPCDVSAAIATLPVQFRLRTGRRRKVINLREFVRTLVHNNGDVTLRLNVTLLMDAHGDDIFHDP